VSLDVNAGDVTATATLLPPSPPGYAHLLVGTLVRRYSWVQSPGESPVSHRQIATVRYARLYWRSPSRPFCSVVGGYVLTGDL